jgi:hypothetical protein
MGKAAVYQKVKIENSKLKRERRRKPEFPAALFNF